MSKRVKYLIRETCCAQDVEILNGHVSGDHVHIFASVGPHVLISRLLQSNKGNSSRKALSEFRPLRRAFWDRDKWAWGYFAVSPGTLTDEVIMQYIELQGKGPHAGDFCIDGNVYRAWSQPRKLPSSGSSSPPTGKTIVSLTTRDTESSIAFNKSVVNG